MRTAAKRVNGRSLAVGALFVLLASGCGDRAEPVQRDGVVSEAHGVDGVRAGVPCTVRITPESRGGFDCRVTFRCGDKTLYGGDQPGGYGDCAVQEGRYMTAGDPWPSSQDGDPSVRVDLARGEAIFSDDRPARRVVVALRPPSPPQGG